MINPSQEKSVEKSDSGWLVLLLNVGFSSVICASKATAQRKKERKKVSSLHNGFVDMAYPISKNIHYVIWGREFILNKNKCIVILLYFQIKQEILL